MGLKKGRWEENRGEGRGAPAKLMLSRTSSGLKRKKEKEIGEGKKKSLKDKIKEWRGKNGR